MQLRDHKIITKYAKYVVDNDRKLLNKADWRIIGADLKTTDKLRSFITRKIVMSNIEIANKTITDLLVSQGIKPERGMKILKIAESIAIKNKNSSDLIKVAKEYNLLHDLMPQRIKFTESRRSSPDYEGLLPPKETVTKTISTTANVENREKTPLSVNEDAKTSDK